MPFKSKADASAYMRAWRKNNIGERVEANRRAKTHRVFIKSLIRSLKDGPCQDCGVKYPHYVMDFDHRDGAPKRVMLSGAHRKGLSERLIREEVAKCDLVCSNCHRERTHRRRVAKLGLQLPYTQPEIGSIPVPPTI